MRSALLLFFAFLPAVLAASVTDEIETAVKIHATNSEQGVEKVLSIYKRQPSGLPLIKSVLYERQNYRLYAAFLRKIPVNAETAGEVLQMDLILGLKEDFPGDLTSYLKYYPADSVAEKYPDLVASSSFCLDLLESSYQPALFRIAKKSFLRMRRCRQFDSFLSSAGTNAGIPPAEVKNYISESWPSLQRNVGGLLNAFALTADPDMAVYKTASDFVAGRYTDVLGTYDTFKNDLLKKETQFKSLQIDLPYFFFYSLFRNARYSEAIQNIGRFYFPDRNDLAELRFLCYLGLQDTKKASREIQSMRQNSKTDFYTAVILLPENPTNGMEYLERYIQEPDESQKYLPEAVLAYYTLVRKNEKLPAVMDLIRERLLIRGTAPVPEIALSYPLADASSPPADRNSCISGYVQYVLAAEKTSSGDKDTAKKKLFELIRSTNTSPVVRSMAVYQARNLQ